MPMFDLATFRGVMQRNLEPLGFQLVDSLALVGLDDSRPMAEALLVALVVDRSIFALP